MDSIQQENMNKITYLSLIITNLLYVIIVTILHIYVDLAIDTFGFYAFVAGCTFSLITMSIIAYKGIKEEKNKDKVILHLAIAHVPCIIGLFLLFIYGFAF